MANDSQQYWADRAKELEEKWWDKSQKTIEKELAEHYLQALYNIQKEIEQLYGAYAVDNKVSIQQAREILTSSQDMIWRKTLRGYIRTIGNNTSPDNPVVKELNTLSKKSQISRLEKLYGETLGQLGQLGVKVDEAITNFLTGAYKDCYTKNLYNFKKKAQFKTSNYELKPKEIENVLRTPWSGANYSSRIWKNQHQLAQVIKQNVTNGIHRGVSVNKLTSMVKKEMGLEHGKGWQARRLVRTELNYAINQASLKSIADAGGEFYIYMANIDEKTSQECRDLNNKVFLVSQAQPGTNMPPMHPNCRSTIAIKIIDKKADSSKNEETIHYEKSYYVDKILSRHRDLLEDYHLKEFEKVLAGVATEDLRFYEFFTSHKFLQNNDYLVRGEAGYYDPSRNHIRMSLEVGSNSGFILGEQEMNYRRPKDKRFKYRWSTKLHEEFHQIDKMLGKMTTIDKENGQKIISIFDQEVIELINKAYEHRELKKKHIPFKTFDDIENLWHVNYTLNIYLNHIVKEEKTKNRIIAMVTDGIQLTTANDITFKDKWGHGKDYNKKRHKNGATSEMWAEFGAYKFTYTPEQQQVVRKLIPKTIEAFERIYKEYREQLLSEALKFEAK